MYAKHSNLVDAHASGGWR